MKYSAKRAAMILIQRMIENGSTSPLYMNKEEMQLRLESYGWKITDKRAAAICDQAMKVTMPLQNRIKKYLK